MEHILTDQGTLMGMEGRAEAMPTPTGQRRPGWRLSLAGAMLVHAGLLALLQVAPDEGRRAWGPEPEVVTVSLHAEAPVSAPAAVQPAARPETAPRPVVAARRERQAAPTPPSIKPAQPARSAASPAPAQTAAASSPSASEAAATAPTPAQSAGAPGQAESAATASGLEPAEVPARPRYRDNPPPTYPERARRLRLEGTVVLAALVDGGGTVDDLAVHASSGHQLLDDAALRAVRGWLFEPGKRGGLPVTMQVLVPVRFALR